MRAASGGRLEPAGELGERVNAPGCSQQQHNESRPGGGAAHANVIMPFICCLPLSANTYCTQAAGRSPPDLGQAVRRQL